MRVLLLLLMTSSSLQVFAADTDGGVELEGRWELPERNAVVRFERVDGGWRGVIEQSPRQKEVGFELLRSLKKDEAGAYRGTLAMPEDGSAHEARVSVEGAQLKAVVGAWIFSKTLVFKRSR
ncbi:MAG: hypothetical protein ACO1OB_18405 [Archangium sp.]